MAGGMQAELNSRLMAQILSNRDVAVDGLRHLLDYESLSTAFPGDFRLLFIDSSTSLRFERLKARGSYADFASFQLADSHPVEQQIDSLRARAARVIPNDGSLQHLYSIIDETISLYRKEGQS
jgi:dephospho-CoA kinase